MVFESEYYYYILLYIHSYFITEDKRKICVSRSIPMWVFTIFGGNPVRASIYRHQRAYRLDKGTVHTLTPLGGTLLCVTQTKRDPARARDGGAFFVVAHLYDAPVQHEEALRYVDAVLCVLERSFPVLPKDAFAKGSLAARVVSMLAEQSTDARVTADTTSLVKLETSLLSRKGVVVSTSKRPQKRTAFRAPPSAGTWGVEFADGSVYATHPTAVLHEFVQTARTCVDACIASFVLNRKPAYAAVTYVSSDAVQDTYY